MTVPKPPDWLSDNAKAYYTRLSKKLPKLEVHQQDLLALMADNWETYQSARSEVENYAATAKSFTVVGSTGNPVPHPAFKVQKQALDHYITLARQLRLSLDEVKTPEAKKQVEGFAAGKAALDAIINKANKGANG